MIRVEGDLKIEGSYIQIDEVPEAIRKIDNEIEELHDNINELKRSRNINNGIFVILFSAMLLTRK